MLYVVPGSTIRGVANTYGVSESTIRFRLKKISENKELGKSGRKCVFSEAVERELAECIAVVCNYGFSPSMCEFSVSLFNIESYVTLTSSYTLEYIYCVTSKLYFQKYISRKLLVIILKQIL